MYNLKSTFVLATLLVTPSVSFTPLSKHQPKTKHGEARLPHRIQAFSQQDVILSPTSMFMSSMAEPQNQSIQENMDMEPILTSLTDTNSDQRVTLASKKNATKKPSVNGKSGILSPLVLLIKNVMGDEKQFNELRAKIISLHSDVIASFVDTAETEFGRAVLKFLFDLSDINKDGNIQEAELKAVFQSLGFHWLKDKQVQGILSRADENQDGQIDLNEWFQEAPKTLRTNLIKLAKKNGGELGLLV